MTVGGVPNAVEPDGWKLITLCRLLTVVKRGTQRIYRLFVELATSTRPQERTALAVRYRRRFEIGVTL